jgi:phthiocerol/phenolphthiocerol synthesis type-I polyketide synthase E
MSDARERQSESIAVIGMAGRFPGARDIEEFWRNLCAGVESISFYSREELEAAGIDPALLADGLYVRAGGDLMDADLFDAGFFGFSPREAEILDPQHRIFMECAWEALEQAGYATESHRGVIGAFGGMGMSLYLLQNLLSRPDILKSAGPLQLRILNDKDFLVSHAAYKLNLTGPCATVQTACSSSLVATCMACQSLLDYQCDMALAGGVCIAVPLKKGYLAQDSVLSSDGHCRAFDAEAQGTVEGNGAGVVLLKRLSEALADGDPIHAVIRGFATNNDGAAKLAFTAPTVEGQVEVVAMAQALAEVDPATITSVEAHGTGTPLGDLIEATALREVFAAATERTGFCALGSVKTNIGHLDAAAGVASLIKTVLSIERGLLPASLNFHRPNPRIDFASSPFYVNTELREWRPAGMPRRAGVSSFGMGGVNAHVVLEEAPEPAPTTAGAPWQLLLLSARTETALEAMTDRLIGHLEAEPGLDLADVAYTTQVGRRPFRHRRLLVCRDRQDAVDCLKTRDPRRVFGGILADVIGGEGGETRKRSVAFLFPGLGNHYAGMARDLYRSIPRFRELLNDCAARLRPHMEGDLLSVLDLAAPGPTGPPSGMDLRSLVGRGSRVDRGDAEERLRRTALSQPAIFVIEYALARLLMDWGIEPQALLGFSLGEYVAACLAGVLSLSDALRLVAHRARLIGELPPGAMLAVPLGEEAVLPRFSPQISLAAVCGPHLTILAGPEAEIAALEETLTREGHSCRRLQTEHPFHSAALRPAAAGFRALIATIELHPPNIPYISNVTGTWITDQQATDPDYWTEHLLGTVRFSEGIAKLWQEPERILLEVGPGQTLSAWALQHPAAPLGGTAIPTLRHALDRQDDLAFLLGTLGRLWLAGHPVDWAAVWAGQKRRRVVLPTYPFERQRYWIEPRRAATVTPPTAPGLPAERSAAGDQRGDETPAHARPRLPVPFAPPRNEIEESVAAMMGTLLRVEQVGIDDSFFDLGGDSLLASHLISRLNDSFAAELSLRTVFESPTAATLALAIVQQQASHVDEEELAAMLASLAAEELG